MYCRVQKYYSNLELNMFYERSYLLVFTPLKMVNVFYIVKQIMNKKYAYVPVTEESE